VKILNHLLAAACAIALASASAAAPAAGDRGRDLVQRLVAALNSGDQAAFERFAEANYAPEALAENDPAKQADFLARIYTDTGGFDLDAVTGAGPGWVQAEAHDRMSGTRFCLTVNRSQSQGRDLIRSFTPLALFPAGRQLTPPAPDEVRATVSSLLDRFARRELFSGVVLIAKDGRIIFRQAYGSASPAYAAPMTLATRLNTASIGKSFTGVAIAQLVDAGKLSYDDKVGKVLPDFPNKDVRDNVTVRQLLSHTSGLGPDDTYNSKLWPVLKPRLRSIGDYMRLVADVPRDAKPGDFTYSNAGYIILGAMIERLSGQSYYDYVQQHIFAPAGMKHSFYHELDHEDPDVAVPLTNLFPKGDEAYIYRLGAPRDATYELAVKGASHGGAFVTADDLFAFERALDSGKLVSPARLKDMMTVASPGGAGAPGLVGDAHEGLGVEVLNYNGHQFYGHTGGDLGVASFVYWYPDLGYTTIALTNRDPRATRVLINVTRSLLMRQTLGDSPVPPQHCVAPAG
jgi:CubicO group peptidase (beta-lactamase class C family)